VKMPTTIVSSLDQVLAEAAEVLCGRAGSSDVIDASVVLVARRERAVVVTSDVGDLLRLDPGLLSSGSEAHPSPAAFDDPGKAFGAGRNSTGRERANDADDAKNRHPAVGSFVKAPHRLDESRAAEASQYRTPDDGEEDVRAECRYDLHGRHRALSEGARRAARGPAVAASRSQPSTRCRWSVTPTAAR
jgi:hypothetical protein